MDPDRASQLLARERQRIEQAIAALGPEADEDQDEPGDEGSENLYQKEFDADRAEELRDQLSALERAEARLAAGTYGVSVESGKPTPDRRPDALPKAQRTGAEQELGR